MLHVKIRNTRIVNFTTFSFRLGLFFIFLLVLLEKRENVKVLHVKVDFLFFEAGLDYFCLFTDWFGPTVNFLENNLHQGSLEL